MAAVLLEVSDQDHLMYAGKMLHPSASAVCPIPHPLARISIVSGAPEEPQIHAEH